MIVVSQVANPDCGALIRPFNPSHRLGLDTKPNRNPAGEVREAYTLLPLTGIYHD